MDRAQDPAKYARIKKKADKLFKEKTSAYKSLWIVREYKKEGGTFDKKKPKVGAGLSRWLKEKWVQVAPYAEHGKLVTCGVGQKGKACRPSIRVNSQTPLTVTEVIQRHGKKKTLQLARKKAKSMRNTRVDWKIGTIAEF